MGIVDLTPSDLFLWPHCVFIEILGALPHVRESLKGTNIRGDLGGLSKHPCGSVVPGDQGLSQAHPDAVCTVPGLSRNYFLGGM